MSSSISMVPIPIPGILFVKIPYRYTDTSISIGMDVGSVWLLVIGISMNYQHGIVVGMNIQSVIGISIGIGIEIGICIVVLVEHVTG